MKTIFRIFPAKEMNKWQKALENVDFVADTENRKMIRNRIEKLSESYKEAFDKYFPIKKNVDENKSTSNVRLGR